MILYEFKVMELNERMEVVNQQGAFIDNHITTKERYNLYAISMFFCEVVYNSDTNTITEIRSFKTRELLDKYSGLNLP